MFLAACGLLVGVLLTGCHQRRELPEVRALVETQAVPSHDDAADDMAIWVHPEDPAQSRVLGTNKQSGLHVYDLEGRELQHLAIGKLNNVDLRQGVSWGDTFVDIAAATNRTDQTLALFLIDAEGVVMHLVDATIATDFADPYGVCLFHEETAGLLYLFANDKDGRFAQWRLQPGDNGHSSARAELVRAFRTKTQPEGCVVDDPRGVLYFGEEEFGLWRTDAGADAPFEPQLVDRTGEGRLVADVEGMSLYRTNDQLLLLVSSQGDDSFAVYDTRDGDRYVGSFRIADGEVDGVSETDGIETAAAVRTDRFPAGLLVVQDGNNRPRGENQNFKLVSMRDVLALFER